MARKTILVCDNCGKEVDEAKGAVMRVTFTISIVAASGMVRHAAATSGAGRLQAESAAPARHAARVAVRIALLISTPFR